MENKVFHEVVQRLCTYPPYAHFAQDCATLELKDYNPRAYLDFVCNSSDKPCIYLTLAGPYCQVQLRQLEKTIYSGVGKDNFYAEWTGRLMPNMAMNSSGFLFWIALAMQEGLALAAAKDTLYLGDMRNVAVEILKTWPKKDVDVYTSGLRAALECVIKEKKEREAANEKAEHALAMIRVNARGVCSIL
jgi:hypothetical protein